MRIFVNFLLIVRVFAVSRLRLCGLPVDIERVRRGLLFEQDPGEDPGGGQERDDGDQLAHADARGEQIQAVGAQTLDPRAAEAVPGDVEQEDLAVEFPLFR